MARSESTAHADFSPPREMAEDGRSHPILGRSCSEGMARAFRPDDAEAVAALWIASSDFLELIVTTVPALVDAAERDDVPEQGDSKHRVLRVADVIDGDEAGGMIAVRRRKARGKGVKNRERLDTEDLWLKDPLTRSTAYFDGRIEYGAADDVADPTIPEEGVRVRGWSQVYRAPPADHAFLMGAQVDLVILYYGGSKVELDGAFESPCYGMVRIEGTVGGNAQCPAKPASHLGQITFRHGSRSLTLGQDDDPCDDCVWWSFDGGEPVRLCPDMWKPVETGSEASTGSR